jgi:ABC-type sulfate transport system permease component
VEGCLSRSVSTQILEKLLEYAVIAIRDDDPGHDRCPFLAQYPARRAFLRAGVYFPVLAPIVVIGLIWVFMVHPDFGALNLIIRGIDGEPLNFLGTTALALPTIALAEIWRGVGFWAVFWLAALIGLPAELCEAAHLDGTSAWQRFIHITVPNRPRSCLDWCWRPFTICRSSTQSS